MRKEKRKEIIWVFGLLLLDRISKVVAINIGTAFINTGISFGILLSRYFAIMLIALFLATLTFIYKKNIDNRGLFLFLIGGAANFFDRIIYGGVVDFISFLSFPMFNFSDVFIAFGAILILVDSLKVKKLS